MSRGVLYIAFGSKAHQAAGESYASLLANCTTFLPACSIGDGPVEGMQTIPFQGEARLYNKHLTFLNGEIKPFLAELTPFEETLYLDADTVVLQDVIPGFVCLREHDLGIACHHDNICLRDVPERPERDDLIARVGEDMPLLNTGVLFFRKNEAVQKIFVRWYMRWKQYQRPGDAYEWDDQLGLHWALHDFPAFQVYSLPLSWNQKYKQAETVIWHQMGSFKAQKKPVNLGRKVVIHELPPSA